MKQSVKTVVVRQLVFLVFGVAIAFLIALYASKTLPPELALPKRCMSDGCFVSAVLFLSVGALLFVSYWGGFDSFSYVMDKLKHKTEASYFDYVRERHAGKKSPSLLFFTTGLVMFSVSLFMALWT